MTKLEKSRTMKCFGQFTEQVELDPDPKAKDKLMEVWNCTNCSAKPYCDKLTKTL